MVRFLTTTLFVLLATVSFALAQDDNSLEGEMNAQLTAQGLDPATATDAQKEAALDAVFEAAIAAELGSDVAGATNDEIAAAVNAIVARNTTLGDNTVGALAAAATKLRPSAAAAIAGQAAAARPSASAAVTYNVGTVATAGLGPAAMQTALSTIAVAVAKAVYSPGDDPAVVGQIAAAASIVYSERRGYAVYPASVFVALGSSTGLGYSTVSNLTATALGGRSNEDAALMNGAVFETKFGNLGNEFLDPDTLIDEENPSQDASPT